MSEAVLRVVIVDPRSSLAGLRGQLHSVATSPPPPGGGLVIWRVLMVLEVVLVVLEVVLQLLLLQLLLLQLLLLQLRVLFKLPSPRGVGNFFVRLRYWPLIISPDL